MKSLIGVYIIFITVIFCSCDRKLNDAGQGVAEKPPVAVEAVRIGRGLLNREVEASGIIAGINEAYVVAETQGIIQSVRFEIGDSVPKGNVLIKVDNQIPKLNLEQARIRHEDAQLTLNVTKTLYEKGSASKAEYTRAQSAEASAKAAYESALKAFRDCIIKAPISGHIAYKDPAVAIGNFLAAGTRLARIVDISWLKLEVGVGEREISFIENGAKSTVSVPAACRDKIFEGKVKAVAAGSNPKSGSYTVLITWENTCDRRLKAGMSAKVVIETAREEPILLIPTAALVELDGRDAVYIVSRNRAAVRFIAIGRKKDNRTEVLDGVEEKDLVIVSGLSGLAKGDRIKPTVVGESGE